MKAKGVSHELDEGKAHARGRVAQGVLAAILLVVGVVAGVLAFQLATSGDSSAETRSVVQGTATSSPGVSTSSSTASTTETPSSTALPPTTTEPQAVSEPPSVIAGEMAAAAPKPEGERQFIFPVASEATRYDPEHHDYPAADMFAECGTPVRAVTDSVVEEVETVDQWAAGSKDGSAKSGLAVALVDSRGVRYYGSHMASVSVKVGDQVRPGREIGTVGDSGNAAGTGCHLHFGLSPACLVGWDHRRGHVLPQPYLDQWRIGKFIDPLGDVEAVGCTSSGQ
ncbi:MAG: M23 family metallopeptidase [Microthrixaceae bacterium]